MCATKLKLDFATCACIRSAWMEHRVRTQMKYLLMCLPGCLHNSNNKKKWYIRVLFCAVCGLWENKMRSNTIFVTYMNISSTLLALHSDILRGILSRQRLVPWRLASSVFVVVEILHFIWILLNQQTCWICSIGNKPLGTSRSFLSVDSSLISFYFYFVLFICFVIKTHFAHLHGKNAVQCSKSLHASIFFLVPYSSCINLISVTYGVYMYNEFCFSCHCLSINITQRTWWRFEFRVECLESSKTWWIMSSWPCVTVRN